LIFVFSLSLVNAANISNIETVDKNTIEITTDTNIKFSEWKVAWMLKLLKDIKVSYSAKDTSNSKKVVLNLTSDLNINTTYSLITVLWAEWDIDFTTWTAIQWEIVNSSYTEWSKTWLKKINIIDARTVELYFAEDLVEDIFEFKILSEMKADNLSSDWNNILKVQLGSDLEKISDYIVMVVNLSDVEWNPVDFWQWLFDFVTPVVIPWKKEQAKVTEQANEVEMTNASNVTTIAMNSAETPDTWAATWVLISLAIMLNLIYITRKKILN